MSYDQQVLLTGALLGFGLGFSLGRLIFKVLRKSR